MKFSSIITITAFALSNQVLAAPRAFVLDAPVSSDITVALSKAENIANRGVSAVQTIVGAVSTLKSSVTSDLSSISMFESQLKVLPSHTI